MKKLKGKVLTIIIMGLLMSAVYTSVVNAVGNSLLINAKPALENVRDYAAPASRDAVAYAVDGGLLFAGQSNHWVQRPTPSTAASSRYLRVATKSPGLVKYGSLTISLICIF